jgi:hypothetical protein
MNCTVGRYTGIRKVAGTKAIATQSSYLFAGKHAIGKPRRKRFCAIGRRVIAGMKPVVTRRKYVFTE